MLTLFPRIRPNPIAPPPLPLEPPEPKGAEPTTETVSIRIEEAPGQPGAVEASTEMLSAREAPPLIDALSTGTGTATSVSDSDVFGAFLSGMATGNSEPFIVEITARPNAPEPQEDLEASGTRPQGLPERGPEIVEAPPVTAGPSADEAVAPGLSLPDAALAPSQNPERISEAIAAQEGAGGVSPELIMAGANIFDELDVLHEAATASSLESDTLTSPDSAAELSFAAESQNKTGADARGEDVPKIKVEKEARAAATAPRADPAMPAVMQGVANEIPAAIPDEASTPEDLTQEPASAPAPVESATEQPVTESNSTETAGPQIAAQDLPAIATEADANNTAAPEEPPTEGPASQGTPVSPVPFSSGEAREEIPSVSSAHLSPSRPPKPRRAKGTFFGLARVPEPETMDDSGEVEAYASAAAQAHLDAIDDTFVAHAQLLLKGRERGRVLDIGTGPGQIVIKLGYRLTRWKFVGIDRSATMIEKAMESLATAGELAGRVEFRVADGNALDCPDNSFEMVVCNSVLHHIPDPQKLFSEIARVVKPGGAVLLRDLRRPSRPGYTFHVRKHGKHYTREMRRLFIASVQAAYTEEELQKMLTASPLRDVRVFRHGKTHIGFERPLAIPATSKR